MHDRKGQDESVNDFAHLGGNKAARTKRNCFGATILLFSGMANMGLANGDTELAPPTRIGISQLYETRGRITTYHLLFGVRMYSVYVLLHVQTLARQKYAYLASKAVSGKARLGPGRSRFRPPAPLICLEKLFTRISPTRLFDHYDKGKTTYKDQGADRGRAGKFPTMESRGLRIISLTLKSYCVIKFF